MSVRTVLKQGAIWYAVATIVAIPLSIPPLLLLPVGPEKTPIMMAVIATSWILSNWLCFRGGVERIRRQLPARASPD